jgi:4-oxalocrotonate tautomerase family enzyme
MPNILVSNAGALTDSQAEDLIKKITQAIVDVKNCHSEAVTVSIHSVPMSHIGVGGKSWRQILNDS